MRDLRPQLDELGATAVAVGFSPPAALAQLAEHLGWSWPFLSDPERVLYERLELGQAGHREVYTEGTRRIYREAAARGQQVRRPVEDARQLGGDAVVSGGTVLRLWRPSSPDDRVPMAEILAAVASAAGRS